MKLKGRTCRLLSLTSQLDVQRDHKWHAVVYVNSAIVHSWIKIKQVVNRVNERWNVTTKRCELNSFHSNTERKKQDRTRILPIVNRVWHKRTCKWSHCAIDPDVAFWHDYLSPAWMHRRQYHLSLDNATTRDELGYRIAGEDC